MEHVLTTFQIIAKVYGEHLHLQTLKQWSLYVRGEEKKKSFRPKIVIIFQKRVARPSAGGERGGRGATGGRHWRHARKPIALHLAVRIWLSRGWLSSIPIGSFGCIISMPLHLVCLVKIRLWLAFNKLKRIRSIFKV